MCSFLSHEIGGGRGFFSCDDWCRWSIDEDASWALPHHGGAGSNQLPDTAVVRLILFQE